MVETSPPKKEMVEATLQLACGHFAKITQPLNEYLHLAEQIEERNPKSRVAKCEQCDRPSVITCVYSARSLTTRA